VVVGWGDYKPEQYADGGVSFNWRRMPRSETLVLTVPNQTTQQVEKDVPNSGGLKTAHSIRPVESDSKDGGIPRGTLSAQSSLSRPRKLGRARNGWSISTSSWVWKAQAVSRSALVVWRRLAAVDEEQGNTSAWPTCSIAQIVSSFLPDILATLSFRTCRRV
jgi:hypothetical protein